MTGIFVEPKYFYFNFTDKTMIMRFERMVNFNRLGEYTDSKFSQFTIPTNYNLIGNFKTGNFDVISYFDIGNTISESSLDVTFTRIVNWNYGDPAVFYTIDAKKHTIVTGWYDVTWMSAISEFTGEFISIAAKSMTVGSVLFDPKGFTMLLKLWSYTQFIFYLNIELPLFVKKF